MNGCLFVVFLVISILTAVMFLPLFYSFITQALNDIKKFIFFFVSIQLVLDPRTAG